MKLSALPILAALAVLPPARPPRADRGPAAAAEISMATLTTAAQSSRPTRSKAAPRPPGEERAVSYIAERFGEAGLQPGNRGSWFQEVPLVETTATPSPLRIAGGNGPLTFNYRTDMVANTYQVQPRVALENSDIVFVGYGINAPERNWNDYAGVDVRGKTVVILVNDPDWQTRAWRGRSTAGR